MANEWWVTSPYTATYDSDVDYAPEGAKAVAAGTQTAAPVANKLIDVAADFGGVDKVAVGDRVHNTTDATVSWITAIDSPTQLSLSRDIMNTQNDVYSIGRAYSSLATWESDSDNDLSGTGITTLDCFDSQTHDDLVTITGATNTDTTHYRRIRSASECLTPFAGKDGTGANFIYDGTSMSVFYGTETYFRIEQLCLSYIGTRAAIAYGAFLNADHVKIINCVAYNCVNQDASNICCSFYLIEDQNLFYNCIAYGGDEDGFRIFAGSFDETTAAVCCTAVGNAGYGFYPYISVKRLNYVWSCYGANNTSGDFYEATDMWTGTGWNSSKDTSSDLAAVAGDNYKNSNDLITGGELDADYLATESIDWNGNAGDRAGRNPYNDFSAVVSDFDDFLRNDTAGDPLFKYDIAGNERPGEAVADTAWDVGASEFSCPIDCAECPATISVQFSNLSGTCIVDCVNYNSTYVLTRVGNSCVWQYVDGNLTISIYCSGNQWWVKIENDQNVCALFKYALADSLDCPPT